MRWLAGLLFLFLLGAGTLLTLTTDGQPLVERGETISTAAVAQARRLFLFNDPRRLRPGERRQVAIPASLIDEGVNYLASRRHGARGAMVLRKDQAEVRLSFPVPLLVTTRYLNLRAIIPEGEGQPRIAAAALGKLPLPASLAEFSLAAVVHFLGYQNEWRLARGAIRRLTFQPARHTVVVAFVWEPAILEQARSVAISGEDLKRVQEAQQALAAMLAHRSAHVPVPLAEVLRPMLTRNREQSLERRRAALLVIAAYLSERNLSALIPEARHWPRPTPVVLTLMNRHDSAQHFAISAALAAWAGEPVADAIGLYKELEDARHGSGFSFADLAADRAGTRFGELLVQESDRLDPLLNKDFTDADLVPRLDGLPEYVSQDEFRRRYGGPGAGPYERIVENIERRLSALPLYQ